MLKTTHTLITSLPAAVLIALSSAAIAAFALVYALAPPPPTTSVATSTIPVDQPTSNLGLSTPPTLFSNLVAFADSTDLPAADYIVDSGVFIWSTSSTGIAALRKMQLSRYRSLLGNLVIADSSSQITAMPAQGLSVEDRYALDGDGLEGGSWGEFRKDVLNTYGSLGIYKSPLDRLTVEPHVARDIYRWYVHGHGARPGTIRLTAHLLEANNAPGNNWVLLRDVSGQRVLVRPHVWIDASVEGDLARKMGAHYRFGMSETVYGPETGPPPVPDGNKPETWIQRVSILLTLQIYNSRAPSVAHIEHIGYDRALYSETKVRTSQAEVNKFATSWSMTHVLPNNKRELNETWSDYPLDIKLPHTYIFGYDADPLVRFRLRNDVIQYVLNKVRYLQNNGYSNVGVANIPSRIYLREGIRALGRETYTETDIADGRIREPIAFGRYAVYDVHLPVTQDHTGANVYVPMQAILSADIPDLLIPGPISTDHRAYNSAVRMEPMRADIGGAAGILAAIAIAKNISPAEVPYAEVQSELIRQGYRLGP
ncbi:MAG: FAD-dependent oxidoreductase [Thermoleophilia bacterium]